MLAASVFAVVVVGIVVAVGVIPEVLASSAPGIDPEDAVPAFRIAVVLHLLVAVVLAFNAMWSSGRGRTSTWALVVTGVVVLLFGFTLADAALAFLEAGSSVRTVTALLFSCVAADILAGALAISAAFLRPKRTEEDLTSASSGTGRGRLT